ncbi:MAG: class I mannose-6-phosphate isomerase [Clostridia bacterium]|nr:class I mannose-6-phosphate isomerase [Oscillospiraceae bacterium]MBR2410931.1 class I mannose-6-phosphate isomerase [Clostridia bacterium]
MEILSLYPTLKETIWGGRTLIDEYGFETDNDNAAEAWLLSCHKDGPSFVIGGKYDGKTLSQVIEEEGKGVLGTNNKDIPDFPVLIKIIDARDKLSVQVHPDDEYARAVENENGKTEAWYVLSCDEGASLIYGVNHDMTKDEFASAIENGTLLDDVNVVSVKPGDVVFIPSGMLHAIGEGILLAEVQQSSNSTYRVFDYNRRDKNGNLRELHIKKAVDVVDLGVTKVDFSAEGEAKKSGDAQKTYLTGCEYFKMTAVKVRGRYEDICDETSFVSLLVLDGSGTLTSDGQSVQLKKGSSIFIPAGKGKYTVSGELEILETRT